MAPVALKALRRGWKGLRTSLRAPDSPSWICPGDIGAIAFLRPSDGEGEAQKRGTLTRT